MSEKVLGFKEKDAVFCTLGDEALYFEHYRIAPNKLVSVVSLECLEKELGKIRHKFLNEGLKLKKPNKDFYNGILVAIETIQEAVAKIRAGDGK